MVMYFGGRRDRVNSLVGKSEPEDIVDVQLQRFDRGQENHVTIVKLDPAHLWSVEQDRIGDVLAHNLKKISTINHLQSIHFGVTRQ